MIQVSFWHSGFHSIIPSEFIVVGPAQVNQETTDSALNGSHLLSHFNSVSKHFHVLNLTLEILHQ